MSEPLRIAIVEDEQLMREGLSAMFSSEPDFKLVAAVGTGSEAYRLIDREPLDVLLVDLGLPDVDGREVIRRCKAAQPLTDVVVVTVFGSDDAVFGSLAAGATGFIRKDEMPATMVDSVRTLRAGGSPVSPSIARRLLAHFHQRGRPASGATATEQPRAQAPTLGLDEPLSSREIEILELVSKGLSVADIGALLHISGHTVGTHVKNIYRKLAVHSRTEAVYEARQLGLLR